MKNHLFKTILLTTRPPFLLLSLSIVILGSAIAVYQGAEWSVGLFGLITLGAVLSHAAVNLLNEYQDFQSGLDSVTEKTPFSGGSGALPTHPEAAPYVFKTFLAVLALLVCLGAIFIFLKGWALLPLGGLGLLLIVTYTSKITHLPWVCLVAPGFAFGPIMVSGVYFVWTGEFSVLALVLSMVPFFWVNNLLLLNQIPDLKADQTVGRFNILMQYNVRTGVGIFTLFAVLSYLVLWGAKAFFQLPVTVWLAFLGMILVIPMLKILFSCYLKTDIPISCGQKLQPALGMNVIINILTPILIALGLLLPSV